MPGTPGKVTTVAELEAQLKGMVLHPGVGGGKHQAAPHLSPQQQHQMSAVQHHLNAQQQQQQAIRNKAPCGPEVENDMTAFNKLLGMMKQSGTLKDSPKMPVSYWFC